MWIFSCIVVKAVDGNVIFSDDMAVPRPYKI